MNLWSFLEGFSVTTGSKDDDQAPTIFYPIICTCYLFQTCIKRSQLEQNMWHYKIGDLLKEVQFIQIFYDRTRKG